MTIVIAPVVFSIFHNAKTKEVDLTLTDRRITEGKIDNPRILIKFDQYYTKEHKEELEKRGYKFLNYRGENSWIVEFPKSEINFLKSYNRAVLLRDLKLEDKVVGYLLRENQPSWIDNGDGMWNLMIQCYYDVNTIQCRDRLQTYGIVKERIGINLFEITVHKDNIRLIAEDDYVLAVSRTAGPPIPLLDESKITIGAGLLTNTPYNLNGDGIIVAQFEAPDNGATRPDDTHSDLSGRILYGDNSGSASEHATQVAGILGGAD